MVQVRPGLTSSTCSTVVYFFVEPEYNLNNLTILSTFIGSGRMNVPWRRRCECSLMPLVSSVMEVLDPKSKLQVKVTVLVFPGCGAEVEWSTSDWRIAGGQDTESHIVPAGYRL